MGSKAVRFPLEARRWLSLSEAAGYLGICPDTFDRTIRPLLSPSKVVSVTVVDAATRSARVVVPDFQLSLAIGKEGQNARLAARLTGWRLDIRSDTE